MIKEINNFINAHSKHTNKKMYCLICDRCHDDVEVLYRTKTTPEEELCLSCLLKEYTQINWFDLNNQKI